MKTTVAAMSGSNIQDKVIIVVQNQTVWVVGTETSRGFTEAGAEKALPKVLDALPNSNWDAWIADIHSIKEILALKR